MMKVTEENCKGCPVFEDDEYKENMIKFDNCPKKELVGCDRDEKQ